MRNNHMQILHNVSLKLYSTMRLGGHAKHLVEVIDVKELQEAITWAEERKLPYMIIGQGSNIVWRDEGYQGIVIISKILGFTKVSEDSKSATYEIGSGEDWDSVVARTVSENLSGIECLSYIPGTAGATPVQNVGAYGTEISNVLIRVSAYDNHEKKIVTLENNDCGFGYRTSRFKTVDKGRFFIVNITLKLRKSAPEPPFYGVLEEYFKKNSIENFTAQNVRDAVVAIRKDKLPDWHTVANNGSFFANPIVDQETFLKLQKSHPEIVGWEHEGGYKLSAGWLLETAGLRGYHDDVTGMATSDKSALVLINEHAASTAALLAFKEKLIAKVKTEFGIQLEQEPELLP